MNITAQSLRELLFPSLPWEIDFRDVSIETKAALYSIKKIGGFIFSILTALLGAWLGTNFVKGKALQATFNEVQGYVSNNEAKNASLLKLNRDFYAEKDKIAVLIDTHSDGFDVQKFLQDLIKLKPEKIKFYEVLIQEEKKDLKQQKINFTVRLNGWVKDDISLVESLKNDILKCPSLSQIPNCKSFFQLDQDASGFQKEEIRFQLTLQSNE